MRAPACVFTHWKFCFRWAAVLAFEIVLNGFAMFTHANLALPLRLDRALRWMVVTPDMHRIHHSVARDEHDSNFGFNVSWWDRLFCSYREAPRQPQAGSRRVAKPATRRFACPAVRDSCRLWRLRPAALSRSTRVLDAPQSGRCDAATRVP